jgi:hypothetical protein
MFLYSQVCIGQDTDEEQDNALITSGLKAVLELRGPVHTVTQFEYQDNSPEKPIGSQLQIRDPSGNELEEFSYSSDGKILWHRKFTRSGKQLFKIEFTDEISKRNTTFVQRYDSDGRVAENENYDADGALIRQVVNHYPVAGGAAEGSSTQQATDVTAAIAKAVGDSRRTDPTIIDRTYRADGTTVEDAFFPRSKVHIYKTTDAKKRLLELINDVPGSYERATYHYDDAGHLTESASYDRSGKVLRTSGVKHQEDATGNWTERLERCHPRPQIRMALKDGKPYVSSKPDDTVLQCSEEFREHQVKPDGTTVDRWKNRDSNKYSIKDANNRLLEQMSDESHYFKATYVSDQHGRFTEIAEYDRSGNVVGKETTRYQDDAHGNWTEMEELRWDIKPGAQPKKLLRFTRRTITYY